MPVEGREPLSSACQDAAQEERNHQGNPLSSPRSNLDSALRPVGSLAGCEDCDTLRCGMVFLDVLVESGSRGEARGYTAAVNRGLEPSVTDKAGT